MLADRKKLVEKLARNSRLREQIVQEYGSFLRTLFGNGDWFVTLTFRDRHQDSDSQSSAYSTNRNERDRRVSTEKHCNESITKCTPDPRLTEWEPDSKHRKEPGPLVRDAALREIEHWLLELGWDAAGHTRQEMFDRLADGVFGNERRGFARTLVCRCLICAILNDPVTFAFYFDIRTAATAAIGWVIAEEFGRLGGRWHVHLLIKGVHKLRRKKWWRRAFFRFGRTRIEPIHA